MKYAVIDCRMSEKCRESLIKLGFKLIFINKNVNLDPPVSAHPDISVFIYKNIIIAEKNCVGIFREHMFKKRQCDWRLTEGCNFNSETEYPYDCSLNFAVCGKHLIGNVKNANPMILEIANKNNLELVNVNQGYAKCNICIVSENALITEDKGIADKCRECGIDVLLLNKNSVKLDGYNYGFIGGATGTVFETESNKILFCGNVEKHPEYDNIKVFCKKHGAVPISLSDEELYDYGSIIIFQ